MRVVAVVIIVCACSPLVAAEPKLSAKVEKVAPPDALAEPVRELLDEQALVVREGDAEVMTVWFRTEIPVKATAEQVKNGLTYQEIPEGELVGAVRFPAKFTDFRKQEIPAGVYTLRFAIQPDIGDHTGTAPHPDFCLMCQAEKDRSAAPIEKKKLIEVSKGESVFVATVKRPVATEGGDKTTLGFAVTVAGVRKE